MNGLPVNIEELINGGTVEGERIAFKAETEKGTRSGLSWDKVKEWEINSLEDVDQLLGYLLEQKSNQVANQVGDRVGDIADDKDRISDQGNVQVGDHVGNQIRNQMKKYFGTKLGPSRSNFKKIHKTNKYK